MAARILLKSCLDGFSLERGPHVCALRMPQNRLHELSSSPVDKEDPVTLSRTSIVPLSHQGALRSCPRHSFPAMRMTIRGPITQLREVRI